MMSKKHDKVMLLAAGLGMAAAMNPRGMGAIDDVFAALDGPRTRTLTREEALEAFKPSAEDLRRIAAAEDKRARKAEKLRRVE